MDTANRKNRILPALGNLLQMFAGGGGGDETAPPRVPPLSPDPTTAEQAGAISRQYDGRQYNDTQFAPVDAPPVSFQPPPISGDIGGQDNAALTNAAQPPPPPPPLADRVPPILAPSQNTQARVNAIHEKDYGKARYNERGELIRKRGEDRDPKWSLGEKILGGVLGFLDGGVIGAIQNGTDRNFMEKRNDAAQMSRLLPQLGQQQQAENFDLNQERIRTINENTRVDNRRQADQRMDKIAKDADTLKETRRKNFFTRNKYFDPNTATAAQKRELSEFGESPETIGKYDFSKPNFRTVAGTDYQYNPSTKSFDATNLPTNDSKEIVEYTVADPNTGVVSKYATTSEKAAGLKTQLASAGLQIQAADRRQTSQQVFTADEKEKERSFTLKRDGIAQSMRLEVARFQAAQASERQATSDEARKAAAVEREASTKRLKQLESDLNIVEITYKKLK